MKYLMLLLLMSFITVGQADEFTEKDLKRWKGEFEAAAKYGRKLWINGAKDVKLGTNNVACAKCHPNAANTHPETYPKFQKQLGKVAYINEMVNWCIRNPLEGEPLELDSKEMTAILAYMYKEREGVKLRPGKH